MTAPLADNPPPFSDPPVFRPAIGGPPAATLETTAASKPRPDASTSATNDATKTLGAGPFGSRVGEAIRWLANSPVWAWLTSAVVHATGMIALSLLILTATQEKPKKSDSDLAALDHMQVEMDQAEVSEIPIPSAPPGETSLGPFGEGNEVSLPGERADAVGNVRTGPANAGAATASGAGPTVDPLAVASEFGTAGAPSGLESLTNPLASRGGGLNGRHFENRHDIALAGGGTDASERAVEAGLVWLANHQWDDGGWRFDLNACPKCNGYCRNSGTHTSATAATGLALLGFLGAGYTQKDGKYQEVVSRGLYFLQERMTITDLGGDLRDSRGAPADAQKPGGLMSAIDVLTGRRDSMYSHAIASLAITEAYAMTRDPALREPAEKAVKFIINAQYGDGGWRYNPASESPGPGDMTVSGWQLTVLKCALLAGIDVPYDVWIKASAFMDGLQFDNGAGYQYVRGERGTPATTAIGLLCRMITGWPRDYRPLQKGVAKVGAELPQENNMYFNFYASQVLHHVGGPLWEKWNPKMRDYLVKSQGTEGHETGSWYFAEAHSTQGGRLYTTALAVMTLEVYYRYMPIYQDAFIGQAR